MKRRTYLVATIAVVGGCLQSGESRTVVETTTEGPATTAGTTTDRPPVNEDLVIEEQYAVDGTMVNVGAEGTAKNTASTDLVDCVIEAQGEIEGTTYRGQTERDRLGPDETWEWSVEFGDEADATSEPIQNLSTTTRANYAK